MLQPRFDHSVTLLQDGRVLVAGGSPLLVDGNADALASAELYDPATGFWTPTGDMTAPRVAHVAVLLRDGRVLVAGGGTGLRLQGSGFSEVQLTATAELYDPATGTWERTGDMAAAHGFAGVLLPNDEVLVAGSWSDRSFGPAGRATPVAELYDPATGTWRRTGDLAVPRFGADMLLLPGDLFVLAVGGFKPADTRAAERYDVASGTWRRTGELPIGAGVIDLAVTLLADGRVLVAGGRRDAMPPAYFQPPDPYGWIYSQFTERWSRTSRRTGQSGNSAARLPSGKVLVSGGGAEVYVPATDTWTPTPDLPVHVNGQGSSVVLHAGEVLHVGGTVDGPVEGFPTASVQHFQE